LADRVGKMETSLTSIVGKVVFFHDLNNIFLWAIINKSAFKNKIDLVLKKMKSVEKETTKSPKNVSVEKSLYIFHNDFNRCFT